MLRLDKLNMKYLLETKNLYKFYNLPRVKLFGARKKIYPVFDVNIKLKKSKNLAIAGESGSGKTTLVNILSGLDRPAAGDIFFEGKNVAHMDRKEKSFFRRSLQMVFQDPFESINPKKTIFQTLIEPLNINKIGTLKYRQERVKYLASEVGLSQNYFNKFVHQLSGGQRQRVAIARALMLEPKIVIADEPVSALDVSVQAQIINLLLELQEKLDITYIIISHDLSVLRHMCDEFLIYYSGRVCEMQFSAAKLFETKKFYHPYTGMLLKATFFDIDVKVPQRSPQDYLYTGNLYDEEMPGCKFYPRCGLRSEVCLKSEPKLREFDTGLAACHNALTQP